MGHLIRNGLIGLAVAAGLYFLLFFVLTQVQLSGRPAVYWTSDVLFPKGGHAYQRFREFNPDHQYGVLVLGSSHAYRNYDPRIFAAASLDMFNLGSSSQTMLQTYYLAEALVQEKSAAYVILDLYETALIGDGMESTADLSQNLPNERAANSMLLASGDIRCLNMWTLRQFMREDSASYLSNSYLGRGYVSSTDSVGERKAYQETGSFRPKQIRYLERFIRLMRERNLPLVAVYSPLPTDYGAAQDPTFEEIVLPLLERYEVRLLDYRSALPLNDEMHFFDQHHLNQAGVEHFNRSLLKDLGY